MDRIMTIGIATYCMAGGYRLGPRGEYHAAEDYHLPAGTPVYSMADGVASYSGTKEGYGWLIILDHPPANLYGHLSPSRRRIHSALFLL
ncbi:M23 family metallopeptidase [Candidatus Bipolaricaulota bacterium]